MEGISDKKLKERLRFLSDKMESLWETILPKINEFEQCRTEFENILDEITKRSEPSDT